MELDPADIKIDENGNMFATVEYLTVMLQMVKRKITEEEAEHQSKLRSLQNEKNKIDVLLGQALAGKKIRMSVKK